MRTLIALLAVVVLSGCSLFKPTPIDIGATIIHPERPVAVSAPTVNFRVDTIGDEQRISLSQDDVIDLGKYLVDITRYIEQNNSVLCFYRKDLAEPQCVESEK